MPVETSITTELAQALHESAREAMKNLHLPFLKWNQLDRVVQDAYRQQAHYLIKMGYIRETRLNW